MTKKRPPEAQNFSGEPGRVKLERHLFLRDPKRFIQMDEALQKYVYFLAFR